MGDLCRAMGISEIHEAGNGVEAFAILAQLKSPPGLALVDLEMPGMNGIGLIKQMYEQSYNFPVIIVSGQRSATIDAAKALLENMGIPCWGTLQKPVDANALQELLRSELS